jgi:hypothetical protein
MSIEMILARKGREVRTVVPGTARAIAFGGLGCVVG